MTNKKNNPKNNNSNHKIFPCHSFYSSPLPWNFYRLFWVRWQQFVYADNFFVATNKFKIYILDILNILDKNKSNGKRNKFIRKFKCFSSDLQSFELTKYPNDTVLMRLVLSLCYSLQVKGILRTPLLWNRECFVSIQSIKYCAFSCNEFI